MNRTDDAHTDFDHRDLDAFERALLTELREHVATRTAPVPLRRRTPLLLAAAAAVVAIAVTVGLTLPNGGTSHHAPTTAPTSDSPPPAAPTTASGVLVSAAYHARHAPADHGRYWYTNVITKEGGTSHDETWTPTDGNPAWVRWNGGKVERQSPYVPSGFDLCDDTVTYRELMKLTPTPEGVVSRLRAAMAHNKVPKDAQGSFMVECLLGVTQLPVTPEVRSSAYLALNKLPGTRYIGPKSDSRGRLGIELGFTDRGTTATAIFAKKDGSVLEDNLNGYGGGGQDIVIAAQWADSVPTH